MMLFMSLLIWRVKTYRLDTLAYVFLGLFIVFLFYSLNYRILVIHLTSESLNLKFGIFSWTVQLDNIESSQIDEIPWLVRYGGAGIHFIGVRKRYRASFNFLEYPRVVIALKRSVGLVQDISFSTRQPEQVLRLLREAITEDENT